MQFIHMSTGASPSCIATTLSTLRVSVGMIEQRLRWLETYPIATRQTRVYMCIFHKLHHPHVGLFCENRMRRHMKLVNKAMKKRVI